MLYQRLITRSFSKSWLEAYNSVSGSNIFAFEFDNNTNDLSGNEYNATLTGSATYTSDDPALGGGTSINVTGGTQATFSQLALVTGSNPFSVIGIVNVPSDGFGNNILWMGGHDPGSTQAAKQAASISFWGSGSVPKVAVDFSRSTVQYTIDPSLVSTWMTVIVTYSSPTLSVYVAGAGQGFTLVGDDLITMDLVQDENWLFAWHSIRRFVGACAFVGMKGAALTSAERDKFLIP